MSLARFVEVDKLTFLSPGGASVLVYFSLTRWNFHILLIRWSLKNSVTDLYKEFIGLDSVLTIFW